MKPVVIDNSTNPIALVNCQIEVTLDRDSLDWDNLQLDGNNIRLHDDHGLVVPFWLTAISVGDKTASLVATPALIPAYSFGRLTAVAADISLPSASNYDVTMYQEDILDPDIEAWWDGRDALPTIWPDRTGRYTAIDANERTDTGGVAVPWLIVPGGSEVGTPGTHFSGSRSIANVADAGDFYNRGWQITGFPVLDEFTICVDWIRFNNVNGRNDFRIFGWQISTGPDQNKGIYIQTDTVSHAQPRVTMGMSAAETTVNMEAAQGADGVWHMSAMTFKAIHNLQNTSANPPIEGKYMVVAYADDRYIGETSNPLTMPALAAQKMYLYSNYDGAGLRGDFHGDRVVIFNRALSSEEIVRHYKRMKRVRGIGIQSRLERYENNPIIAPTAGRPTAQEPQIFYQLDWPRPFRLWHTNDGVMMYADSVDGLSFSAPVETSIAQEHPGFFRYGAFYYNFVPTLTGGVGMRIFRTPANGNGLVWTDTGGTVPIPSWRTDPSILPSNANVFPFGDQWQAWVDCTNSAGKWQVGRFTAPAPLGPWTEAPGQPSAQLIALMKDPIGLSSTSMVSNLSQPIIIDGVYYFVLHGSPNGGNSNLYMIWTTDPTDDSAWQMRPNPIVQCGDRIWEVDQIADGSWVYVAPTNTTYLYVSAMNNDLAVQGRIYVYTFKGTPAQLIAPLANPTLVWENLVPPPSKLDPLQNFNNLGQSAAMPSNLSLIGGQAQVEALQTLLEDYTNGEMAAKVTAMEPAVQDDLVSAINAGDTNGLGDGDTEVDQDLGGVDALRYVDGTGAGIDNANVIAYLKEDYDAGNYTARARTVTRSDGRWVAALRLNSGLTYTFRFEKPGVYGPNIMEGTVP